MIRSLINLISQGICTQAYLQLAINNTSSLLPRSGVVHAQHLR
jgi:hypothetical protein